MTLSAVIADPLAQAVAAGLLALVFARGAWHKAADRETFGLTLAEYRLLPQWAIAPVGAALPAAEAAVAAGLVLPATRPWAALAAIALLLGYAAAIAVNLRRGRIAIDCGCGGPGHGLSWLLVLRNLLLVGAASLAAAAPAGRPLGWSDALLGALGVATAWLALLGLEQVADNDAYRGQLARGGTGEEPTWIR